MHRRERYDLVCIGSGPAGEKAALMAASAGKRVAIVERQSSPGGAMVNTGTIASKVLRETALLCSAFRRRPIPGVGFTLDRAISLPRFMARKTLVQIEEHDRIERSIDRQGIDVLRGNGRIGGDHRIDIDGADGLTLSVETEHVLIATGSRPFRPDSVKFAHPHVVDADGILELDRMPRSLVVVGGGVIGSEYACIFAEMGVETTIIEPRDALLPFLDPEIRTTLLAQFGQLSIRTLFGCNVESVAPEGDRAVVRLKDGRIETADSVLWALGRIGNTDGIGLEKLGITPDKRGLLTVDGQYRTSVPWIWAAGDVIGFPALASTSLEQGRIAACHMFGIPYREKLAATVPIGIYTIPAIGAVGLTEDEARAKGLDVVVGRARYRNNPRGRMLGDDQGLCKLVFDANDRKLLGASVIGEDATELVHLAQTAIVFGAGIDFFVDACLNYPSLGELFKYAAIDAAETLSRAVRRAA
ncbi:MAG: Si-specific NAD(P)(+) transhydrogenase [Phycisphaerae bacterium]|nr:Si-specific NAD(P)(+) transhydrogenase [Phycisphaerae bacterium]